MDNKHKPVVVIPNLNGADDIEKCVRSVLNGSLVPHLIMVDNGSIDDSVAIVERNFPEVEIIRHTTNKGYAGGVNPGFRRAITMGATYVAPFNNDAVADRQWLQHLVEFLDANPHYGIATCKVASADGQHLDSTGDQYTTWGLPYPRGRGEADNRQYDDQLEVFAASGAASVYRVSMLQDIGLLDEDFFAYYEDVDISFRAQLAGYRIAYVPQSYVLHQTSTTGSRIKGFFTYQTMKNLPMLLIKNVPRRLLPTILPRFLIVYCSFFVSALQRGQLHYALKGWLRSCFYLPRKLQQRRHIQKSTTVDSEYIGSLLLWDLPPNATRLRVLRNHWRHLRGRPPIPLKQGREV